MLDTRRTTARGRSPAKRSAAHSEVKASPKPESSSPAKLLVVDTSARARSPLKRKSEHSSEDDRKAKRHQLTVPAHISDKSITDLVEKPLENGTASFVERPPVARKDSETSESLSSPEKSDQAAIAEMIDKARKFLKYWDKYKALHDKVTENDGENEMELESLWRMHNRLIEMKKEIWDEHERLGSPAKIVLG